MFYFASDTQVTIILFWKLCCIWLGLGHNYFILEALLYLYVFHCVYYTDVNCEVCCILRQFRGVVMGMHEIDVQSVVPTSILYLVLLVSTQQRSQVLLRISFHLLL
jgi:hypothetical protein